MSQSASHQDQPKHELQSFTDAVRMIVSVSKDQVKPDPDAHKLGHKYEEWKCPDCGKVYVKHAQHKHEDQEGV